MKKIISKKQRGSIAVYAILLMAVTLAIALPAIKKSTQNIQLSEDQQTQKKTLNAAEQTATNRLNEIHQAYISGGSVTPDSDEDLKADGTVVKWSVDVLSEIVTTLTQGTTIELTPTGSGNVQFYWWDKGVDCRADQPASLMFTVYTKPGSDIIAKHYAVGPCNSNNDRKDGYQDNFTTPGGSIDPNYLYSYQLPVTGQDIIVRFKPVYNDTAIRVIGPIGTPQSVIRTQAEAPTEDVDTSTVQIDRIVESGPAVLDYSLVSGSTISQ